MQKFKPLKTVDEVYEFCQGLINDLNYHADLKSTVLLEHVGCKGGVSALQQVIKAIEMGRKNGTD